MLAVYRKELVDYFNSARFFIMIVLVCLASALAIYSANQGLRAAALPTEFTFLGLFTASGGDTPALFSFVNLIALLIVPLIGISLGFDAINKERSSGTISRILSQPVFRDSVINGKFLAGLFVLFIMMLSTILLVCGLGMGLRMLISPLISSLGLNLSTPIAVPPPTAGEIFRLSLYLIFSVVYGAFWMGLSILFSVLFNRVSTSLLCSVAVWLFFGVFYLFIAPAIANAIIPTANAATEVLIRNYELQNALLRVSPNYLFSQASQALLQPMWAGTLLGIVGIIASGSAEWMVANPLPLDQSILLIWPHLTLMCSLTLICFAISYVVFMKQEIRST